MAVSISNLGILPCKPSKNDVLLPFFGQNLQKRYAKQSIARDVYRKSVFFASLVSHELDKSKFVFNGDAKEAAVLKKQEQDERKLSDCWRDIHGEDDWVGLLDPMDPLLRTELIRYVSCTELLLTRFGRTDNFNMGRISNIV